MSRKASKPGRRPRAAPPPRGSAILAAMRKHRAVVAQDLRVDAAAYAALADASPCGASDAATAAPRHPGCSPLMPAAVDRVAATDGPATGPSPASPPFSDAA